MTVWWEDKETKTIIPQCSQLFIDKISITLPIADDEKSIFIKNFKEVIEGFYPGKMYESPAYVFNKKGYDSEGGCIFFQAVPKFKCTSIFRVEYNPSKIVFSEFNTVFDLLLPGGLSDLWNYGRVTRIDIATDISKLAIHNLGFYYPGIAVSEVKLKNYKIQTAYLGSSSSVNQFVFYDKVAELKYANSKVSKNLQVVLPTNETTRIELRHRPKGVFFKDLYSIGNKFEKLSLSLLTNQPGKPKSDFEGLLRCVFELSKERGLQSALQIVPKHSREKIRKDIQDNLMTKWWDSESLWQTYPKAIDRLIDPS